MLQLGQRLWWEAFSCSDQLYMSQVSTPLLDYPDIRSPSGRQVTARWTTSQLRQQDIPETQLLQQNNGISAQAPGLAGWQHISAVQQLWAYHTTNRIHTLPFQKHLFPFSRQIAHTGGQLVVFKKIIRIKSGKLFAMCAETKGARQMISYQPSSTPTKDWETQEQYIH